MSNPTPPIKLPNALEPVFTPPRGEVRYRYAYGGRGSGKSFSFALMAAMFGWREKLRILCTRELQVSIKESFHAELKNAIQSVPWLAAHYDVGVDYLRGKNGTEFIFRGLRHNMSAIKSMAQIDICIVEEAEDAPEASWIDLEPTIRAPKSEIWVIWNPRTDGSPVDNRFVKHTPPRAVGAKVNYSDNPWFPQVLEEQRQHAQQIMDYAQYAHIWLGKYWSMSDAQVFRNRFTVDDSIQPPAKETLYYGADWGFSVDPTALIRCWCNHEQRKIFIDYEAYQVGCEIDHLPALFDTVPDVRRWCITADSARPETISYMNRNGFKVSPAKKGKDSVIEGINFLKSYQIVIHPRCQYTLQELRLYSYKRDRLTNEVLPILEDSNNHGIDAMRYALEQLMNYGGTVPTIGGKRVFT